MKRVKTIVGIIGYLVLGFVIGIVTFEIYLVGRLDNFPKVEVEHYALQVNGYNYCPYCGENLEE